MNPNIGHRIARMLVNAMVKTLISGGHFGPAHHDITQAYVHLTARATTAIVWHQATPSLRRC